MEQYRKAWGDAQCDLRGFDCNGGKLPARKEPRPGGLGHLVLDRCGALGLSPKLSHKVPHDLSRRSQPL